MSAKKAKNKHGFGSYGPLYDEPELLMLTLKTAYTCAQTLQASVVDT